MTDLARKTLVERLRNNLRIVEGYPGLANALSFTPREFNLIISALDAEEMKPDKKQVKAQVIVGLGRVAKILGNTLYPEDFNKAAELIISRLEHGKN